MMNGMIMKRRISLCLVLIITFLTILLPVNVASADSDWTISEGSTKNGNLFTSGNANMTITSGNGRYDFNTGSTVGFSVNKMADTGSSWNNYIDLYIINKTDSNNQNIHLVIGKKSSTGYTYTLIIKNKTNGNVRSCGIKIPDGENIEISVFKANNAWNFIINGVSIKATDAELGYSSVLDMSSAMLQFDMINGSGQNTQMTINSVFNTVQDWKISNDNGFIVDKELTVLGTPTSLIGQNKFNFNSGATFNFEIEQFPKFSNWRNYLDLYIINNGQYIKMQLAREADAGSNYTVVLNKSVGAGNIKAKAYQENLIGNHTISCKKIGNEWNILFDGYLFKATDAQLGFTNGSDLSNAYLQIDAITNQGGQYPILRLGNIVSTYPSLENEDWTAQNAFANDKTFTNSVLGETTILQSKGKDYSMEKGLTLDFDIAKAGYTGDEWLNQTEIAFVNDQGQGVKLGIGNYEGDSNRIEDPLTVGVQKYGVSGLKSTTTIKSKVNGSHSLSIIEDKNSTLIIVFDSYVYRMTFEELGLNGFDLSKCSIEIKCFADFNNKPEIMLKAVTQSFPMIENDYWSVSEGVLEKTTDGYKVKNTISNMDTSLISKKKYNANNGITLDFSIDKIGKSGDKWDDQVLIEILNGKKSGITLSMGDGEDKNKPLITVARKKIDDLNVDIPGNNLEIYNATISRHTVSLTKLSNGYWVVNVDNILSKPFEMNGIDLNEVSINITLMTKTFAELTVFNTTNTASVEVNKGIISVNNTKYEQKDDGTIIYNVFDNRQKYFDDNQYNYFMREKLPSVYGYDVNQPITITGQFLSPAGPYMGIELNSTFGDYVMDNSPTSGPAILWITGSRAMYIDKDMDDGYYNENKYYKSFVTKWNNAVYSDKGCIDEITIDIGKSSSKFYINGVLIGEDTQLTRDNFESGKVYINFLFFANSLTAPKSTSFALRGINAPRIDSSKIFVDKKNIVDLEFTVNSYNDFYIRTNSGKLVLNKDYTYDKNTKKLVIKKEFISKLSIGKSNLMIENTYGCDSIEFITDDSSQFKADVENGKGSGVLSQITSYTKKKAETPVKKAVFPLYAVISFVIIIFVVIAAALIIVLKKYKKKEA